jgi:nucleoside-diphosphate-sugar epimerase
MVWAYEHGNTPRRRPARRADVFCDEDAELRPQNLYAETKVRCEQMLAASQVPSCVMRIATIHGHADAGETRQSVYRMIHQAAGGTVHLFAPDNWRPFIHLGDAAQALQRAIDHPDLDGTYNLAHDHATFGQIARCAAEAFDATIEVDPARTDPRSYCVNTTAAAAVTRITGVPAERVLVVFKAVRLVLLSKAGASYPSPVRKRRDRW